MRWGALKGLRWLRCETMHALVGVRAHACACMGTHTYVRTPRVRTHVCTPPCTLSCMQYAAGGGKG